jgi:hypothetical protein
MDKRTNIQYICVYKIHAHLIILASQYAYLFFTYIFLSSQFIYNLYKYIQ